MLDDYMKNILFINPQWQFTKETSLANMYTEISFPLGIGYLSAVLEKEGWNVGVLDALAEGWDNLEEEENRFVRGLGREEIKNRVRKFKPDIVGIGSPFSSQSSMAHRMAEIVKEVDRNITIILGGAYPSSEPEKVASDKNVDYVFIGEAEKSLPAFLKGENPRKIPGLMFKHDGELVSTGLPERVKNLDDIPFPAYHLFSMDKYFKTLEGGSITRGKSLHKSNSFTIITSRGCPFNCIFCAVNTVTGKKWRIRSPNNVVDEIQFLVEEYGVTHFLLEDDNMTFDKKRFGEICDEIVRRGIKITWETPNGVRGDRLDLDLARKMKEAGCERVRIAIENGNQEFLTKTVQKGLNLEKALKGIKAALESGLNVDCFFMYGVPGENEQTLKDTYDFAMNITKMGANPLVGMAFPIPGTRMYDVCKKEGYLTKEPDWVDMQSRMEKSIIKTEEFSPEDIVGWLHKTRIGRWKIILFRPWLFFRTNFGANILANPRKTIFLLKNAYRAMRKSLLALVGSGLKNR
jgi:magnesium-protoporphyrin IX monomethyl ester (oxidative) cyclase